MPRRRRGKRKGHDKSHKIFQLSSYNASTKESYKLVNILINMLLIMMSYIEQISRRGMLSWTLVYKIPKNNNFFQKLFIHSSSLLRPHDT